MGTGKLVEGSRPPQPRIQGYDIFHSGESTTGSRQNDHQALVSRRSSLPGEIHRNHFPPTGREIDRVATARIRTSNAVRCLHRLAGHLVRDITPVRLPLFGQGRQSVRRHPGQACGGRVPGRPCGDDDPVSGVLGGTAHSGRHFHPHDACLLRPQGGRVAHVLGITLRIGGDDVIGEGLRVQRDVTILRRMPMDECPSGDFLQPLQKAFQTSGQAERGLFPGPQNPRTVRSMKTSFPYLLLHPHDDVQALLVEDLLLGVGDVLP